MCTADSAEILASVVIPPEAVPSVPCSTTLVGELPGGPKGVGGRLYLLNRVTFVVLGFSYDGTAPGTQCCHYLTASIPIDICILGLIPILLFLLHISSGVATTGQSCSMPGELSICFKGAWHVQDCMSPKYGSVVFLKCHRRSRIALGTAHMVSCSCYSDIKWR